MQDSGPTGPAQAGATRLEASRASSMLVPSPYMRSMEDCEWPSALASSLAIAATTRQRTPVDFRPAERALRRLAGVHGRRHARAGRRLRPADRGVRRVGGRADRGHRPRVGQRGRRGRSPAIGRARRLRAVGGRRSPSPDIRVIPVLVGGAKMPKTEELPEDLDGLARRNGLEISDTDWRSGTERLFVAIEHVLDLAPANLRHRPSPGQPPLLELPARPTRRPATAAAAVDRRWRCCPARGGGPWSHAHARLTRRRRQVGDGREWPQEHACGDGGARRRPAARSVSFRRPVGPRPSDPPSQGRCFAPFSPAAAVLIGEPAMDRIGFSAATSPAAT